MCCGPITAASGTDLVPGTYAGLSGSLSGTGATLTVGADGTTVTISTAGGEGVTVEYKEYPEEWSAAKSVAAAAECTVEELNPGSTYQFRLAQGEARGPELVVDTAAPNCTPGPSKACCVVA